MTLSTILTTNDIYNAFYDEYTKLNAFLHSHSYTANPIACSAANATLDIFEKEKTILKNKELSNYITKSLKNIVNHNHVGDVRQHGMIVAIEMVKDKLNKKPYSWKERRGIKAYEYGLKNNVLIRPLGNVIYFMPPYVIKKKEIDKVITTIEGAIDIATK